MFAAGLFALMLAASCGLKLGGGGQEGGDEAETQQAEINCEEQCPCECDEESAGGAIPEGNEPYPMVFAGNVKVVEGKLSQEVAKRKITSQRYALRECYAPVLKENPELKGEMDVQFTVSGNTGKIIAAIVRETTIKNEKIEKCVVDKIKKWSFPKSKSKESVVKFTTVMLAINL